MVFSKTVYDLNSLFLKNKIESLQTEFSNLPLIFSQKKTINTQFKDYTANLTFDLNVYKDKFDKLDSRFYHEPEQIRQNVQGAIIETEGREFMNYLDEKLEEFEYIVSDFTKKEHKRHGFYFRKQLWNLILCSPFMTRTNIKALEDIVETLI